MSEHGTSSRYKDGCHCAECRAAQAAYQRKAVARNAALLPVRFARLTHGTTSTYTNHKCRCLPCTIAWRDECAERREARKRKLDAGEIIVSHGSTSTYTNYGCRCEDCTEASRRARSEYGKRRRREAKK